MFIDEIIPRKTALGIVWEATHKIIDLCCAIRFHEVVQRLTSSIRDSICRNAVSKRTEASAEEAGFERTATLAVYVASAPSARGDSTGAIPSVQLRARPVPA
jgi:hypothetical protein